MTAPDCSVCAKPGAGVCDITDTAWGWQNRRVCWDCFATQIKQHHQTTPKG